MSFTIAFLILSVLYLWFTIYSRGHWAIKSLTIALVIGYVFWVSSSLESYKGWPTKDLPHEKVVEVHWVIVIEPSKVKQDPGRIYVWASFPSNTVEFEGYTPEDHEPRAYEYPYSRKLHESLEEAKSRIKGGERVFGEIEKLDEATPEGDDKADNLDESRKGRKFAQYEDMEYIFHQLRNPNFVGK